MRGRLALGVVAVAAGIFAAQSLLAQARGKISYSRAPGECIISLDLIGGKTAPRRVEEPYLQVYGDGRVVARNVFRLRTEREIRLPLEQIDALMKELLAEHRLYRFDASSLKNRLTKEGYKPEDFPDEPTTVVTITLEGKSIAASQYALDLAAARYFQVDELQRLATGAKRLRTMHTQILTGELTGEATTTGTSTTERGTDSPATEPSTQP